MDADAPKTRTKSWAQTLSYRARVAGLAALRRARWIVTPHAYPAPIVASAVEKFPFAIYDKRIPIIRTDAGSHPLLEAGKRANLQLAAPAFDGLAVGPAQPLSFWRTLGPVTEALGYRHGMSLYDGCVVPAIGGGICLLSNALFALAVELDWQILERHGHTVAAVPPRAGELWGLDATVFYPYVDLRFAARHASRLSVRVEGDELVLRVHSAQPFTSIVTVKQLDDRSERASFDSDSDSDSDSADEYRCNRLVRFVHDSDGRLMSEAVVAENRKLIVPQKHLGQNCLTCGDQSCHARPEMAKTAHLTTG